MQPAYLSTLQDLIAQATAAEKTAADADEVGSIGGATSHPSKDADPGTQTATTGARDAENTSDVKEKIGPTSVDASSPQTAGDQESTVLDGGLSVTTTGKDPANETARVSNNEPDPGSVGGQTSHPTGTLASSPDKTASYVNFLAKTAEFRTLANGLLAEIANSSPAGVKQAEQPPEAAGKPGTAAPAPATKSAEAEKTAEQLLIDAAQAGQSLASLLSAEDPRVKTAAQQLGRNIVKQALYEGFNRADLIAAALADTMKAAEESCGPDEQDKNKSQPESTGDDDSGDAGGSGNDSASDSMSEDQLLQILAGGAGGGDDGMGGMGGDVGMPAGGPPMDSGMMADLPPEAMQALMAELGTNPTELKAAAAAALSQQQERVKAAAAIWQPKTPEQKVKYAQRRDLLQEILRRRQR